MNGSSLSLLFTLSSYEKFYSDEYEPGLTSKRLVVKKNRPY